MIVWTEDISKYIDVYKDKLITKNLDEDTYNKIGNFNIVYDLRDLHSMQLIEAIDLLKNRDTPHVLVSFSIETIRLINAIYLNQLQDVETKKLIYFSVDYKGSDVLECARILNVDGVYNIKVDLEERELILLRKIKPQNKGIVSKRVSEYIDFVLI